MLALVHSHGSSSRTISSMSVLQQWRNSTSHTAASLAAVPRFQLVLQARQLQRRDCLQSE